MLSANGELTVITDTLARAGCHNVGSEGPGPFVVSLSNHERATLRHAQRERRNLVISQHDFGFAIHPHPSPLPRTGEGINRYQSSLQCSS